MVRRLARTPEGKRTNMATICPDDAYCPRNFSWPQRILVWFAVTVAFVTLAFFFIDQPTLSFIRGYGLNRYRFIKVLTRPPEVFVLSSPFVLLVGLLLRRFRPWTWPEKVAVAAAVSTLATALAVLILKLSFGRSIDGFHPFHFGADHRWFPSGHTACTVSVTAVAQIALPRWRLLWWSLAGMMATSLIALNYHFVGDILGGAFVGWAMAGTSARWFGLTSTDGL